MCAAGKSFKVPIEWDILVSEIHAYLRDKLPAGFFSYEVVDSSPAEVVYRLCPPYVGELGLLTIRKTGPGSSIIHFSGLPSASVYSSPMFSPEMHEVPAGKRSLDSLDLESEEEIKRSIRAEQEKQLDKIINGLQAVWAEASMLMSQKIQPGGRPHKKEDIWAWQQVNSAGRAQAEVRKEWENKEEVKSRHLVEPDKQFKRIVKPEWLRGQNL